MHWTQILTDNLPLWLSGLWQTLWLVALSLLIGLTIAIQALVNIGVTTGLLPTKGLTLPLVSYGGSSVVIVCISLGILARIDAESRYQAKREGII